MLRTQSCHFNRNSIQVFHFSWQRNYVGSPYMLAKWHYTQSSFHQPTLPAPITKRIHFYKSYNIIGFWVKKLFNLLNAKTRSSSYFSQDQAAHLYSFPTYIVLHPLQQRESENSVWKQEGKECAEVHNVKCINNLKGINKIIKPLSKLW